MTHSPAPAVEPISTYRTWVMVLFFTTCLTCAYLDKQILSILVEPIRAELLLSDTQIGLLQGFAFSLCHGLMGLPVARAIDRGDRPRIASACIGVWSAATASCALGTNFAMLLSSRAFTAMGEAGLAPAVLSLTRDLIPRRQLAATTTVFMTGPYLGMGIALLGGGPLLGWLVARGGLDIPGLGLIGPWRSVFLLVGVPGFLLALVMFLRIPEPRRAMTLSEKAAAPSMSVAEAWKQRPSFFVYHCLGATLATMPMYAQMAWLPSYFIRVHHMTPAMAGTAIGPIYIIAGISGAMLAAWIARTRNDPVRHILFILSAAAATLVVTASLVTLTTSPTIGLALFFCSTLASSMILTLMPTPLQIGIPAAAIARSIAALNMALAVGGAGFAPFLVGILTDKLFGDPSAVGLSIAITCGISAFMAAIVLRMATLARNKELIKERSQT